MPELIRGVIFTVNAGTGEGSFERLRAGAQEAASGRYERVLVDLSGVDPVDGAMLAVLAGLGRSLGASRRLAVVFSEEAGQLLAEWRLDSLWPTFADLESAEAGLMR